MRFSRWSRAHVSLVLWNGVVTGTRVRGRTPGRVVQASLGDACDVESAVTSVLRELGCGWWSRCPIVVAVGPAHYRLKRVQLDTGNDPDVVKDVGSLIARFAPVTAGNEWVANVTECSRDSAWLLLMRRDTLDALQRSAAAYRSGMRLVVPMPVACATAMRDGDGTLSDQGHLVAFSATAGCLVSHRRVRELAEPPNQFGLSGDGVGSAALTALLAAVGTIDARIAPAIVARQLGGGIVSRASRARRRLAVVSLAAACLWSAIAPITIPHVKALRLERELERMAPRVRQLAVPRAQIAEATQLLSLRGAFRQARPVVEVLAALADRLPDGVAISTLRVDSSGVTLMLLGPQAAGTIAALSEVNWLRNGRLTGGVSRDMVKEESVERATLAFDISDSTASSVEDRNLHSRR